jgi:hypothetical protein
MGYISFKDFTDILNITEITTIMDFNGSEVTMEILNGISLSLTLSSHQKCRV